ncbi:unnamed protein product [Arabidopsis lyrata]|uniref:Uncharacterized protein n=1 Tax=Arabidopsis lyrata subsp. lyrata TaxID=81972 RepID=D7L4D4_ARALL|nr:hypothetical protein ARALYDRAFT_899768 [Arabidopsis lyrata subsp. lyrata]CAH8262318.1 unnamed protein product [Arabidopsis lyrata]
MRNSFQLSFTVLTIFIVCVLVSEAWKGQLPNGQCSLSLPVGPNGKCVSKDCDSSCQHKFKDTILMCAFALFADTHALNVFT